MLAAAVSVQTAWRCKFRFVTTPKLIKSYLALKLDELSE